MNTTTPTYPIVGTLASRALALLLTGRRITDADFMAHAGTYRLSGYVHELRDLGWPIVTIEHEKQTSDRKRRVAKIGVYHLPADAIVATGERGRRFVESVERWELGAAAGAVGAARATKTVIVSTQTDDESNAERVPK